MTVQYHIVHAKSLIHRNMMQIDLKPFRMSPSWKKKVFLDKWCAKCFCPWNFYRRQMSLRGGKGSFLRLASSLFKDVLRGVPAQSRLLV